MAMETVQPVQHAGSWTWDGIKPLQLWAGESQKVTVNRDSAVAFKQYEVYAINAAGAAVKINPSATDGTQNARGFTAYETKAGEKVNGYEAGSPNWEALVWPTTITTFEAARALFSAQSTVFVGQLNP